MRCYLSYPNPVPEGMAKIRDALSSRYSVFTPVGAWTGQAPDPTYVWEACVLQVKLAHLLFAVLPAPSLGVAGEIMLAKELGKPVYALVAPELRSSTFLRWACTRISSELDDLLRVMP
jgi:hypothetical protein